MGNLPERRETFPDGPATAISTLILAGRPCYSVRYSMRHVTPPLFVLGIVVADAAIVGMLPTVHADLGGPSWDISATAVVSLPRIGALLVGVAFMVAARVHLRSGVKRD